MILCSSKAGPERVQHANRARDLSDTSTSYVSALFAHICDGGSSVPRLDLEALVAPGHQVLSIPPP